MTAVPQAAVDAAMKALDEPHTWRPLECSCGWRPEILDGGFLTTYAWGVHRAESVAAAVVAAVQGPIKAEALREAADEFDEFVDVDEAAVKVVRPEVVRHKIAIVLRDAANRLEAQP